MFKIILIMCVLAIGNCGNAQKLKNSDLPKAVKENFKSLYPGVQSVKWENEKGKYEAEFELNKTETSVLFDASGNQLETESEISVTELPQGVQDYAKQNFSGSEIKEAAKITDASGIITYEAEIQNADYIFDANGKFLKKESDSKRNEDENDKDNK